MNLLYNEKILGNFFYIYSMLFIAFLLYFFSDVEVLGNLVEILAIIVLLISWFFASTLFRTIGLLFVSIGIMFSLMAGESFGAIISNSTSNLPLLFFFSILPWIGTVVKVGGLDESITDIIQDEANRLEKIYGKSVFTSYFLAVFLNLSAIYIIQQVLWDLFSRTKAALRNEFIIKSTLRAFALAVIWSPLEVIVGLTVDSTGVSYFTLFPWLFVASIIIGLVEVQLSKKDFRNMTIDAPLQKINRQSLISSLVKMLILLISFLTLVMLLNIYSDLGFIMTVALIIVPFSFITSIIMQRLQIFAKTGWKTWKHHNNTLQNFAVLFLSLGIFSGGFNSGPVPGLMQQVFGFVDSYLVLILILIMVVIYSLAMFGVHPIATLAILAEVLAPIISSDNALSIAIVMVVCGMAISAAAPYGLNATMTSQSMKINPYSITRINIGFAVRMGLIGIFIAMIALWI